MGNNFARRVSILAKCSVSKPPKNVKEMYMGNKMLPVAFRFSLNLIQIFENHMMKHPRLSQTCPPDFRIRPGLTAELLTPDSHAKRKN
jgi:hypothetical protein